MNGGNAIALVVLLVAAIAAAASCDDRRSTRSDDPVVIAGRRLGDIQVSLQAFARAHGAFPSEADGLGALVKEGLLKESSRVDMAGRPYLYSCATPECLDVTVSSEAGPDGRVHSTSLTNRPPSPNQRELDVLEQAAMRDRSAFPAYADKTLNDFFHQNVMAKCISVPHDKTPFIMAFVLDENGVVTKTLVNRDTALGKCLVDGVSRASMPRPPKAPFVVHHNWIKLS